MRWMALAAATVLLMQAARAAPAPTMEILLSPHDMEVVKGPEPLSVVFNGTVRLDKLPELAYQVTLEGSTSEGWPAVCVPSNLTITNLEAHPFTCTVSIPAEATFNASREVIVEVKGLARGLLSSTEGRGDAKLIMRPAPINNTPGGEAPWVSLENSYLTGVVLGLTTTAVVFTCVGVYAILRERRARRSEK